MIATICHVSDGEEPSVAVALEEMEVLGAMLPPSKIG